jgi:hypothetical protein
VAVVYNTLEELREYFEIDVVEFDEFWYSLTGTEQSEWRRTNLREMEL